MRSLLAATLTLSLGFAAPAAAGDDRDWSFESLFQSLGSAFAELFVGPEVHESFHWEGRLAAAGEIEVKGINGAIKVTPRSGDAVTVHAVKRGRRSDPREVEIQIVPHPKGLTICAVYPSPDARPNACVPGERGRIRSRNNDVAVDFDLTLPASAPLVARTVNGSVTARGLQADARVSSVNGSLRLESRGHVEAETVNGSVRIEAGSASAESVNGAIVARLAGGEWAAPLSFKTVNGTVTLTLPADAGAALRVRTTNGRIRSEFELKDERRTRRELSGTLGAGGPELSVRTVNGRVRIQKAI
jgi:hypothetical protein